MSEEKKDIISQITQPPQPPQPANNTGTNPSPEPPKVLVVLEDDLLSGPTVEKVVDTVKPVDVVDFESGTATAPNQDQSPADGKKRRGRPPGSTNRPKADFSDIPPAAAAESLVDYKLMSGALFDMSTGLLTNTFGPEWQPRSQEERGVVVSALEVYLKSKQAKDIPPGLMLTIVVVAYAAPRFQAPTTKEKLMPMISWGWLKVKSFFAKRKPAFTVIDGTKQN